MNTSPVLVVCRRLALAVAVTSLFSIDCLAQNHSQVFFDISGTDQAAVGANELVTISGNLTFYGRNDSRPPGERVRTDFVQPASDIYIMRHGYYHGHGGDQLQLFLKDVSEAPNTILGHGGGGFFEEVIAATHPQGSLTSGEYDIIVDEHQNGLFEPRYDLYLGVGAPALIVKVPYDAPSLPGTGIAAMKLRAIQQYQAAAALNEAFKIIQDVYEGPKAQLLALVTGGAPAGNLNYKQLAIREGVLLVNWLFGEWMKKQDPLIHGRMASFMAQPFDAAVNVIENSMKRQTGLAADPPDPDFATAVALPPASARATPSGDPLVQAVGEFSVAVDAEARLQAALLAALEKYEGAREEQDGRWCLAHARAVRHYSGLLALQWPRSARAIAQTKAAIESIPFDMDALGAALASIQQDMAVSDVPPEILLALAEAGVDAVAASAGFAGANFDFNRAATLAALDAKLAANADSHAAFAQLASEMDAVIAAMEGDPTIDLGDPVVTLRAGADTVEYGTEVTFTADGTDAYLSEPLRFEWDLNEDGAFDDAEGPVVSTAITKPVIIGVRALSGSSRMALAYIGVDVDGSSNPNRLPQITGATPAPDMVAVRAGEQLEFSVAIVEPDSQSVSMRWITDGEIVGSGAEFVFQAPAEPRVSLITLQVEDSAGGIASRSWLVRVTKPAGLADLALSVSKIAGPAVVGEESTWELTIENLGPSAADEVVVTQRLPAGLDFVHGSLSFGSLTTAVGTVTAALGRLEKGARATVWIRTAASAAGSYSVPVSVSSGAADLDQANNKVDSRVRVIDAGIAGADLSVSVDLAPSPAILGATQTITATVENAGPSTASGLLLEVQLPEAVDFVSAVPAAFSAESGLIAIPLSDLPSGASITASVVVRPQAAGSGEVYLGISSAQNDPDLANNQTSALMSVAAQALRFSDLQVTQIPPVEPVLIGLSATWKIVVTNQGPDEAVNVSLLDRLPAGSEFLSASPAPSSLGNGRAAFAVGALAPGESREFELTAVLGAFGEAVNVAEASSDSLDADGAVSSSTVTLETGLKTRSDLRATLTSPVSSAGIGENVMLTMLVTNGGPEEAADIVSKLILPAGLSFVSSSSNAGSAAHSGGTVVLSVPVLPAEAQISLEVVAKLDAARPFIITGETASNNLEPDLSNNRVSIRLQGRASGASMAIIRNFQDPEIEKLQEYLLEMGMESQVLEHEGLTAEDLERYELVIWDDLSYFTSGVRPPLIDALHAFAETGKPLYLIGDDLAVVTTVLSEPHASRWTNLLHLQPANDNLGPGGMTIVDSSHPVTNGPFGPVASSAYFWDPDVTVATGLPGEKVLGRSGEADTLVVYVDPQTGRKSVTQNELPYTQVADDAGREERRKLFKNAVSWLLSDGVPNLSIIQDAPVTAGVNGVVTVSITVTNRGAGAASAVTVRDVLPSGWHFVSSTLDQGMVTHADGAVTASLGILLPGQKVGFSLMLAPELMGSVLHTVTVASAEPDTNPSDNESTISMIIQRETPAVLKSTYLFVDSLAACESDAAPLSPIDPLNADGFTDAEIHGQMRRVYRWDGNPVSGETSGLAWPANGLVPSDHYSLETVFRFMDVAAGVRRIIDIPGPSGSRGLSLNAENRLMLGEDVLGDGIAPSGEFNHLVVTVGPESDVVIYLNGVLQAAYSGVDTLNVPPSGLLHLFMPNEASETGAEFSDGEIALLRIYEGVLPLHRVAAQAAFPFGPAQSMDARRDFSLESNPRGVWSYGMSDARGAPFSYLREKNEDAHDSQLEVWSGTLAHGPFIYWNKLDQTASYLTIRQPPDLLNMHPSHDGFNRNAVLRWTAPAGGTYRFQGRFQGIDITPNGTDVALLRNGDTDTTLFEDYVLGFEQAKPFDVTVALAMGEIVDFSVGVGGNSPLYESTGVEVVVTPVDIAPGCEAGADIQLAYEVDPTVAGSGDLINLQLTALNKGGDTAHEVVVSVVLPSAVEVFGHDENDASPGPQPVTLRLGTLGPGKSTTAALLVRAGSAGKYGFFANVSGGLFDPSPANNSVEGAFEIVEERPWLVVTVRSAGESGVAGSPVNFEIVTAHTAPVDVDTLLTVIVPEGVEIVSVPEGVTIVRGRLTFPVVKLGAEETLTRRIALRPSSPETLELRVEAVAIGRAEIRPASTMASLPGIDGTPPPELRATMNVSSLQPEVGCPLTVTYTLENLSTTEAENVRFSSTLPVSAALISATASNGEVALNGRRIVATIPRIAKETPATVSLVVVPFIGEPLLLGASLEGGRGTSTRLDVLGTPVSDATSLVVLGDIEIERDGAREGFSIQIHAPGGVQYAVQFSDDLLSWRTFPEVFESSGNDEQWIDEEYRGSGEAVRFYRVISVCDESPEIGLE